MWSGLQVVGGSASALPGFLSVSTLIRSGKGAGASALGGAASRVSGQQKACSGVWGTETQGSKQFLLWHKGPKGTPVWRVAQAARTWRWVCWRCGTPGGPVQGPGRLHSHLQEFSVTGGVWLNVSLCSFRWQLPCRSVRGCCQAPPGFWGSGIVPAGPVRTLGPSAGIGSTTAARECRVALREGVGGRC